MAVKMMTTQVKSQKVHTKYWEGTESFYKWWASFANFKSLGCNCCCCCCCCSSSLEERNWGRTWRRRPLLRSLTFVQYRHQYQHRHNNQNQKNTPLPLNRVPLAVYSICCSKTKREINFHWREWKCFHFLHRPKDVNVEEEEKKWNRTLVR